MKTFEQFVENHYIKSDYKLEEFVENFYESQEDNEKLKNSIKNRMTKKIRENQEPDEISDVKVDDNTTDVETTIKSTSLSEVNRIVLIGQMKLLSIQMLQKKNDIVTLDYIDIENFDYTFENDILEITSDKKIFTIKKEDAVNTIALVRSGYSKHNVSGCLKDIASLGILVINEVEPVSVSGDKYLTAELLRRNNIAQPKYCLITTEDVGKKDTKRAEKKLAKLYDEKLTDDTKFVCKILSGHGGRGVFICRNSNIISILQCIFAIDEKTAILVQEYCELKDGDIRVHVISLNGKQEIVDSIIRLKGDKDFRTNLSLGNKMDEYKLNAEQKQLALDAARVSGLVWCGVDIMPLTDGRNMIAEFNGAPGPASNIDDKDIETTNYNFFKKIINTINKLCKQ